MSKLTRTGALDLISNWSVESVAKICKKNGLEDSCVDVVYKRQINGDGLLHLTEGKLALWKKDLSRPQIWSLWDLVEKIRRAPEDYVTKNDDEVSDSGSWGSDFEDDEDDDNVKKDISQRSLDFSNNLKIFEANKTIIKVINPVDSSSNSENIYNNCDSVGSENTYINLESKELKSKNISQLHDKLEKKLILDDQYKNLWSPGKKQLTEGSEKLSEKPTMGIKQVQKSFLYNPILNEKSSPPPLPPNAPKPAVRNFDAVDTSKIKIRDDNGEYESFDEDIIKENWRRMGSKQSLIQGSTENVVDKLFSNASQEKDSDNEIYESITEIPDDNDYYLQPISSSSTNSSNSLERRGSTSTLPKAPNIERTPEKKHLGGSTYATAEMRATRPLPQPPKRQSHTDFGWYHDITREQASSLIKERAYSHLHNGYFLVRPSTSEHNNPLVLVLWFKDRVYNVPIRKRPDSRFALGSPKMNEQTFTTVEDIIKFYMREELVLYSGGMQMGSTKLTDSPAK